MPYERLDIPLHDLQEVSLLSEAHQSLFLDAMSDYSDSSVVFDSINKAASTPLCADSTRSCQYDEEEGQQYIPQKSKFLRKWCSILGISLIAVWILAVIVYSNTNVRVAAKNWRSKASRVVTGFEGRNITLNAYSSSSKNVSLDDYLRGHYRSEMVLVRWLEPSQFPKTLTNTARGFYLTMKGESFVIRQADSSYKYVLLESTQFRYKDSFVRAENLLLNRGVSFDDPNVGHLIVLDSVRQWRHSLFSLFWLWKPATNEFIPLRSPSESGYKKENLEKLHFAQFDPTGKFVLYGFNRDLFVVDLQTMKTKRITSTGSEAIFNGKPDWVYEEEVNAKDRIFWWSPDLRYIAYASLNDSLVSEYSLDYYTDSSDVMMSYKDKPAKLVHGTSQYPTVLKLKYPKPGSPNPIVSLHLYNVETHDSTEIGPLENEIIGKDFILYDAAWIDKDHFLMKVADRTSTVEQKQVFVISDTVKLISSSNSSSYGGWVEKPAPITLVKEGEKPVQYLDRVVVDDIVQLALFEIATSSSYSKLIGPVTLDSRLVYNSVEHAVYGVFGTNINLSFGVVSLNTCVFTPLTATGKYDARFSSDGQFVSLQYLGPNEPWQKVINMGFWVDNDVKIDSIKPINHVKRLSKILKDTNLPTHTRSTATIGSGDAKVELNIVEILPPGFKEGSKYPLLVHVYGGPGSVTIDNSFSIDFQDAVSCALNAVVLIIEPRGTGKDEWRIKSFAQKKIGYWEPRDVTTITKRYIKTTGFIDKERTAIWGWSYGGFTTLKTLEYDKGHTFKYGMAVAPVTNWLFYDSIYTERYMKLPSENLNYEDAQISSVKNLALVKRFLMMHGTADDNVHVQNSLWLMDKLNMANLENYDMQFFPDSEHSIYHHNANQIVHQKLLGWLQKAFMGYFA